MFLIWHLYFKFDGSNTADWAFGLLNQKQLCFDERLPQLVSLVADTGLGHGLMRHWSKRLSIWVVQIWFIKSFMNLSALHKSSCLEKQMSNLSTRITWQFCVVSFFFHKSTAPSHKLNSHCCSFPPRISFSIQIFGWISVFQAKKWRFKMQTRPS